MLVARGGDSRRFGPRVMALMLIGKLGFCRFLNSLPICVISFSEIRIFVVGGFGWFFFFFFVMR